MRSEEVPLVPMARWGKDHWSTFAYIETRVVDHRGVLDKNHMRCDPRVHRAFANMASVDCGGTSQYPTILRDGAKVDRHDDWSCAEDMVAANVLALDESGDAPRFSLTPLGIRTASALRQHKATGGKFSTFTPDVATLAVAELIAAGEVEA